jgi:hypothetical protein
MGASPVGDLASVWVEGPNRAFAGVSLGTIIGYDGDSWQTVLEIPGAQTVYGVWSGGQQVFSANGDGNVYRDGMVSFAGSGIPLSRIWGRTPTDVVAVGTDEIYGELKGTSWTWTMAGGSESYEDVYGGDDFVVIVGTFGRVLRRRQASWGALQPPFNDDLYGVWAAGAEDIFVVGRSAAASNAGVIHRYLEGTWTTPPLPAGTPKLHAVWGASPTEVYAVGNDGVILTFDGVEWASTSVPTLRLVDVSGFGRDAIAVGGDGSLWRIAPP